MTHDLAFEAWAAKRVADRCRTWSGGFRSRIFARTVILDFYNEAGQLAIQLQVSIARGSPKEYQALATDLDSNANAVAIQHIILENEGWERDTSVTEPTEVSFQFDTGITFPQPSSEQCRLDIPSSRRIHGRPGTADPSTASAAAGFAQDDRAE